MASTASTETSEIRRRGRQRLIGAVAIAVLLVVFVPMILDSEPRPAHPEPSLQIPPKDKVEPLPAPTKAKQAAAEPAKPAPAPAAVPAEAAPKLEGFAVQVGAFKDEEKLKQARDKLVAAKVPHYIERRDTSSGELTRLRAGPYATREEADKALATMKAASMSGQVVPLP
jgi:DedD protein